MACGYIYVNLKRTNIIKDSDNNGNILPSTKATIFTMLVALCALLVCADILLWMLVCFFCGVLLYK